MKNGTGLFLSLLLLLILGLGCGGDPASRMSPEERIDHLQDLLIRGAAHSEIDEWPEAIAQYEEALPLAEGDPVVPFGLAVAYFKSGDSETAREWLDRVDESAPTEMRGRVAYLRGKLALEEGDVEGEVAAYRQAAEIDPSEPAYPYSLSQVVPRVGGAAAQEEVGELLGQAAELWPGNGRIAAELAQWSLGRSEPEIRRRGVDLVVDLGTDQSDVGALVERGLEELAADPDRAPVSLRRALNLLRPGKRFQTDSAMLEARLAVLPFTQPIAAQLARRSVPSGAAVDLEIAALLPEAPFAGQETVLQVEISNDAVGDLRGREREADLTVLTDRGVWFLGRGATAYENVAMLDFAVNRILVGELDGDGWMEILAVGEQGVALWGRSADDGWSARVLDEALAGAVGLREAMLADFEHDGDLDLLAIDGEGQLVLATHRGEAGLGAPEPVTLPGSEAVTRMATVDLDNDVDQDLLLAGNDSMRILTNWRQGEYRVGQQLPLIGDVSDLLGLDYDSDGTFDIAALVNGKLIIWHNSGPGGLALDGEATQHLEGLIGEDTVQSIAAGDIDLDGDMDLLMVHSSSDGVTRLSSLPSGAESGLGSRLQVVWDTGATAGLSMLDMDGDHDPDPLTWGEGGLTTARATGAEGQGWLGVTLRGLMGKVPLDGRGARLDVDFGLDSRSFEIDRPEMVIGLGGRTPALLEVIWPNGISEFLFEPQPEATHVIEQELRIEGSCPFLYAFDGNEKRFITDILGLAPLGMLAGPDRYVPPDPEEYLRLPEWVSSDDSVELSITEELREVAYFDQIELVVVDAPPDVVVYNGERWIEGAIDGLDLRLLSPLQMPAAVRDNRGRDVLDVVADLDQQYLTNHDGERLYQGAVPLHRLEIEVPADLAASGDSALVMTGWLHWGNTSTNLARAQDPDGATVFQ